MRVTLPDELPDRYLLHGGTVLTGWDFTPSEAVVVDQGLVHRAGALEEVSAGLESDLPRFDVGGATVVPGLQDTHFHMMSTGMNAGAASLAECRSIDDVLTVVADTAAQADGEWIFASLLDESVLAEGRAPTAEELDSVISSPLYINDRGLHYSVVNSAAATALGVEAQAVAGAGRLQEAASGLAKQRLSRLLPPEFFAEALDRASSIAVAAGITTVHALEGGELFEDRDAHLLRELRDDLAVRAIVYWCTDDVEAAVATGATRAGGDVCADGSLGSRTAALARPYADAPGEHGLLLRDADELAGLLRTAEERGVQFGLHAIGDRGVDAVVEAGRRAFAEGTRLRHRIEHFGLPSPQAIETASQLGFVIAAQPAFAYLRGQPGGVYESRLGTERLAEAYPLKSLLAAGLHVAGGSDSDVTPADPLLGLHAAVNHPVESERVTPREALRMYTAEAEYISGGEPADALLTTGARADLTIVDSNPLTCDPAALKTLRVVATLVGGQSVYRR